MPTNAVSSVGFLDTDYKLGTPYTIKVAAGKGYIYVWYKSGTKGSLIGKPAFTTAASCSGAAYYKTGLYMQVSAQRKHRDWCKSRNFPTTTTISTTGQTHC
jgi:hypothetical protein